MKTTTSDSLKTKVFTSIKDVPKEQWNSLLDGYSHTYSYEFWEVVEQSEMNDFDYRYVLFFDEKDNPVALTSFYSITTDIAIFAPAKLRWLLTKIRQLFPNFLKLSMLECGTPITPNSPPFVANDKVSTAAIIDALHHLLLKTAKKERNLFIIIRDFEPQVEMLKSNFKNHGYHWVSILPNTHMDIQWPSPENYLASMKSYYRSKLLNHLRKNETQQIRHELVDDFHDLAETLHKQWLVVHNHADEYQREVLTPKFYREFSLKMGSRSKVILFYRGSELAGHALLLMDGDLLRWLFFGRNNAANDSLYIYVGHKVIETAILLGAKRLELGLTTYSIKQDLGAQLVSMKFALRSVSRFINLFVGLFYPLLNHTPKIQNKNIFKEALAE